MSYGVMRWGKKLLFFSLALLIGLFITQQMLEAHSTEEAVKSIDLLATETIEATKSGDVFRERLIEKITRADQERSLLPISSPEFTLFLQDGEQEGTPRALLAMGRIYGVDEKGGILIPDGSKRFSDLPVLTGEAIKFNAEKQRLDGFLFHQAMELIDNTRSQSNLLRAQLSEVNCDPDLGLVAYVRGIPVLIGQQDIAVKARNLDVFFDQLGATSLLDQIKYLDARLASQIVVKKKRP